MRLFLLVALLIAYGSLYPGDFSAAGPGALERFLADWHWFTSLSDELGNIALFFPLGVVGVLCTTSRRHGTVHDAVLLLAALVYAGVLQAAQIWLPSRSADLADVVWNMVGMALGIAMGHAMARHARDRLGLPHSASPLPYAILALWILAELLPLVPSLDWQKFKDALKPLLVEFDLSFPATLLHAAGAMVAGSAFVALGRRPATWLAGALVLVLAGKLAVVNLAVDASMLAGWLAGYLACVLLTRADHDTGRAFVAAFWSLLVAWSVTAITPFDPAAGGIFSGVPFATMLRGSMETNVQGLARSMFTYAALLWLVQSVGGDIKRTAAGLAIWSSLLELTQMGLLGRTADVTEPLLVLLLAWGMSLAPGHVTAPLALRLPAQSALSGKSMPPARECSARRWWIALGLSVLLPAAVLWGVLRLPGIPYNVRELFLGGGHFLFLLVFALVLVWIGAGAAWVGSRIASSKLPYLGLPVWVLAASLVSLALLSVSVTQESLDDIAGSNNLYWFVLHRHIWGDGWKELFALAGPVVVGVFERMGRYAALYSPVLVFLALPSSFLQSHARGALMVRHVCLLLACVLPWMWLAKAVTFDWSSTDNLNELVARDGLMGWGGGGYLYILLGVLCLNAVLLGHARGLGRVAMAALLSVAALPLGWWLLNLGLESRVEKYGLVFSGAQFLLGPDRQHLLSEMNLFARWSVVQIGFVAVSGAGMRIALTYPFRVPRR